MIGAAFMALGILASTIQWGWQKLDDGGQEYIVQVEPQLADIDAFRKAGFTSDVPPGLRDIRRIRIVVGSDPLPHQSDMNAAVAASPTPPPTAPQPLPAASQPQPTASQPQPAAPGTLPTGLAAAPLKTARPLDANSAKVALTDGHQPSAGAGNGSESSAESTAPAVGHAEIRSPSDQPVAENSATTSSANPPRPWLTLLAVAGGLIVSLSGNVFLGWIHWGTRNQYRALVTQLRAQRQS